MDTKWTMQVILHVILVVFMTYHAVEVDSHLFPYSRGLDVELWTLLNGDDVSRPVNLFTIKDSVVHVHGVVANYFELPTIALEQIQVASSNDERSRFSLTLPKLIVTSCSPKDPNHERVDVYELLREHDESWPDGLRLNCSSASVQRDFFDSFKVMKLSMELESHAPIKSTPMHDGPQREFMRWNVQFTYDFSNQGQIIVNMDLIRLLPSPALMIRTPSDYVGRYIVIILLAAVSLVFEVVDLVRIPYLSSLFTLQLNFSAIAVLAANSLTLIYFIHACSLASKLVYVQPLTWMFAIACATQWMTLLRYMSVNPRCYILGLTLQRGFPQVVEFLIGVFPLFVGYVLFGTVMFGATVARFEGMTTTATTLFAIANGDEIRDSFRSLPWLGQVYLFSYIVLFAYVVLMVCIGIMEDSFFTAAFPALWKKQPISEDEWDRVRELIENETRTRHPEMVAIQQEILQHVHARIFE